MGLRRYISGLTHLNHHGQSPCCKGREEAKRLTPLFLQDNGFSPSPPFADLILQEALAQLDDPAGAAKRHWIERGDCSFIDELALIIEGLYFREPPSSTDKPVSRHPALRVDSLAGG